MTIWRTSNYLETLQIEWYLASSAAGVSTAAEAILEEAASREATLAEALQAAAPSSLAERRGCFLPYCRFHLAARISPLAYLPTTVLFITLRRPTLGGELAG